MTTGKTATQQRDVTPGQYANNADGDDDGKNLCGLYARSTHAINAEGDDDRKNPFITIFANY